MIKRLPYLTPAILTLVALTLMFLAFSGRAAAATNRNIVMQEETITATMTMTPTVVIETVTPVPTETEMPTATPTATSEPTMPPTMVPTAVPVDYGNDPYEGETGDSFPLPSAYLGRMLRTFAPAGDVDYVQYFAKAGITQIQTMNLAGAADTYIEVYDPSGNLIARDDDSGTGLASFLQLTLAQEQLIVIVVSNKAVGYGAAVTYDVEIIPQAAFTPTPTPTTEATTRPVNTPRPTHTPIPTAVPTQAPTHTPQPTIVVAPVVNRAPRATPTPQVAYMLRIEVFIDADNDLVLDSGEGVQEMVVRVNTLDLVYRTSGQTTEGIAIIPVVCPPDAHDMSSLEISIPYLGETQVVDMSQTGNTAVVQFPLDAPVLPVQMP